MRKHKEHPEITFRKDALLCSINERLVGDPGQDIEPLTGEWIHDLATLEMLEAQYQENAQGDENNSGGPVDWDDLNE